MGRARPSQAASRVREQERRGGVKRDLPSDESEGVEGKRGAARGPAGDVEDKEGGSVVPSALGGGVSERVPPSGGEAGGALDLPGSVGLGEVLDLVVPARPGGDGTFNADQVEPEKLDEQEQKYTGPRKQGGDVAAGAQNADSRRGEGLGFIAFGSEARQKGQS